MRHAVHSSLAASIAAVVLVLAAPWVLSSVGSDVEPSAAIASADPSFALVDAGVTGSELNIGVTSTGHVFVGGWDRIARSADDGATWDAINVQHVPGLGFAADRVLVVDHDTDRVLVSDTYLACTFLSWSDDLGASWQSNPVACGGGVTDHQKVAVGKRITFEDPTGALYENLIYVCANGLAATNCGVSADGGLTFLPTNQHGVGCAFQGAPVADARGWLYEPTTQCGAQIRRTTDNGLRWTAFNVPVDASRDAPDVAATPDGTVYFFFTTSDWTPAFTRSTDGGFTWSAPVAVTVPGLVSSAFPSIVAGDDGRIGLSFFGTTDDAADWDHNPGGAPDSVRWHGYVAVVTDADAASPTLAPVRVTPAEDPLQYGCISKLGGCLGNIADYMDVDVGPDGRVYAVFTDGCPASCASAGASTEDRAVVAVQTAGPTLKA